jgi:SAM-dependent methyltransferase
MNTSAIAAFIKPYVGPMLRRAGILAQKYPSSLRLALQLVKGKSGIEIGGPSEFFRKWNDPLPIYEKIGALDNCDFSRNTTWTSHADSFVYHARKAPGRTIFSEGSNLAAVANHTYDFVLSCHNLEHFANPVKALKEWQRIARPGGALILILPDYRMTFDHRRKPTPVAHMLEDFDRDMQENDLTHLPEVLREHDLSRDPGAGTVEEFHHRSLNNFQNRCLHHHVFDEKNSGDLLRAIGMNVLSVETVPTCHIVLLAKFPV